MSSQSRYWEASSVSTPYSLSRLSRAGARAGAGRNGHACGRVCSLFHAELVACGRRHEEDVVKGLGAS